MPRQSKGVLYAEDEPDAENSVFEGEERYDILDDNERAAVLSVAQNPKDGIQQAKALATDMINDGAKQAARAQRANRAQAVLNTMTNTFQAADPLAEAVLRAAASGYETFNANVTVAGGPYPQGNVSAALTAWRAALDGDEFHQNVTNVHFYPRQNKRAAGKGNVGGTLDTRKWQANFISTWYGRKINVHVDLPG